MRNFHATATGVSGVSAANGLGDAPSSSTSGGVTTVTSTGTHYYVEAGDNLETGTIGPVSTATGGTISGGTVVLGSASAWVSVTVMPIYVSFAGALGPSSSSSDLKAWQSLPGQQLNANLVVPWASSVDDCLWMGVDPSFMEGVYMGGIIPTQHLWVSLSWMDIEAPILSFYGVASVPDIELGCTGTATFPDGSVQSVLGKGIISVNPVPHDVSETSVAAYSFPWYNLMTDIVFNASGYPGGIYFSYSAGPVPSEFSSEGNGWVATAQLMKGEIDSWVNGGEGITSTLGQWWLDNTLPYVGESWVNADGKLNSVGDVPGSGHHWYPGDTITLDYEMSFRMLNVYTPPANGVGGITTSFSELPWAWNCSVTFDAAGDIPTPGPGPSYSSQVDNDWSTFQFNAIFSNSG